MNWMFASINTIHSHYTTYSLHYVNVTRLAILKLARNELYFRIEKHTININQSVADDATRRVDVAVVYIAIEFKSFSVRRRSGCENFAPAFGAN